MEIKYMAYKKSVRHAKIYCGIFIHIIRSSKEGELGF